MQAGQKAIYFLTGTSRAELEASPFVEQLIKKGYEVIYFTDVLDEYVMQHMQVRGCSNGAGRCPM